MNRNLLSDIDNLYVAGRSKFGSKHEKKTHGVYVYPMKMFESHKTLTTTQPIRIPKSDHTVHIAINSKRLYGVTPNGGVYWYHKKKRQVSHNKLHEEFQKMNVPLRGEYGTPDYERFTPFYTTIEANEQVVVVAADDHKSQRNTLVILHPVTLYEYHRLEFPHGSTSLGGQVDPLHILKLFVVSDLCLLMTLNRKQTFKIFMIHKYKIQLLREVTVNDLTSAMWGLQFHKATNEIVAHGNTGTMKKLHISLKKREDGEDDPADYLKLEVNSALPPEKVQAATNGYKAPRVLKNFQDAIDLFSVKNISDRTT